MTLKFSSMLAPWAAVMAISGSSDWLLTHIFVNDFFSFMLDASCVNTAGAVNSILKKNTALCL